MSAAAESVVSKQDVQGQRQMPLNHADNTGYLEKAYIDSADIRLWPNFICMFQYYYIDLILVALELSMEAFVTSYGLFLCSFLSMTLAPGLFSEALLLVNISHYVYYTSVVACRDVGTSVPIRELERFSQCLTMQASMSVYSNGYKYFDQESNITFLYCLFLLNILWKDDSPEA